MPCRPAGWERAAGGQWEKHDHSQNTIMLPRTGYRHNNNLAHQIHREVILLSGRKDNKIKTKDPKTSKKEHRRRIYCEFAYSSSYWSKEPRVALRPRATGGATPADLGNGRLQSTDYGPIYQWDLPFRSPTGQCERNCLRCSTLSTNVSKKVTRSSFPSTVRSEGACKSDISRRKVSIL